MSPESGDAEPAAPAAVVETHVSTLFFVDDRVYKRKKSVRFPFVDLTARETREALCHREVELNRRLAPDVYLGVADIVFDGEPCDHLVVMRRLAADRRLSALVVAGDRNVGGIIDQVAGLLVAFHRDAVRSAEIDRAGTRDAIAGLWQQNFDEMRAFVGPVLDPGSFEEAQTFVSRFLQGRQPLFEARAGAGMICDGHGDLQAEDIFCLDDGPRILDCIEFNDALRFGDVAVDLAFLAMDLERLGAPELGERLLREYECGAGITIPRALFDFYIAYRAQVRAKVNCWRSGQQTPGSDEHLTSVTAAQQLLDISVRHLRASAGRVVVVGGLPGTGKSTLAAGLANRLGFRLLRSDVVRKELAGTEAGSSGPGSFESGLYAPAITARVYDEMLTRGRAALGGGDSIILDASFTSADRRRQARDLASDTSSGLVELECVLDAGEAASRMRDRARRGDDASDATPEIAAALAATADPWPEATRVDTSVDRDEALSEALGSFST